jgi:hypothetical protein
MQRKTLQHRHKLLCKLVNSSVVYHPITSCLASISMVQALVGWCIRWVFFVLLDLAGTFFEVSGNIFFYMRETLFPLKGGLSAPKGVQSPPFWREKRAPAIFLIPKCTNQVFLWYRW